MKEFLNVIQTICVVTGNWLGDFLKGCDRLLYVLFAFMVLDYITGIMCAMVDRKLLSRVGIRVICRKVLILALVDMGNLLDMHVIGTGSMFRTTIIYFYISNEGLSLIENVEHLGLPVPSKFHKVLKQLHDIDEKGGKKQDKG